MSVVKVATDNFRQQGDTVSISEPKAQQVDDTKRESDFDAEQKQEVGKREKKYIADKTKVTEAVGNEATGEIETETSQEILREASKGKGAASIAQSIANAFGQITARGGRGLFNIIGKKVGSLNKGFKDFVDNTVDRDFIAALPAAYIKQSKELQKILGLKKGCSKEDVLKTAVKLQKKIHPDVNRGDVNSERLSQLVNEAKEKIIKTDFS